MSHFGIIFCFILCVVDSSKLLVKAMTENIANVAPYAALTLSHRLYGRNRDKLFII